MCGIAGTIHLKAGSVNENALWAMMSVMQHRGPDDCGVLIKDNVGLGHLRLSIIDTSLNGHQPMLSFDKRYALIFNGEIYNYVELKEHYVKDYPFISGSDSEVIIAMYMKYGQRCVEYFNGMWAFAILDTETNDVFISRDHFGIKPLYYYQNQNYFYFASEVRALKQVCETLTIDEQRVYEYLIFNRTDQTCDTFIQEIKRVEHGHNVFISQGKVFFSQWYHLPSRLTTPWESVEEYRTTLSSAVKMQLRSDVPIGVCLSGGLDSSALTSVILKDYNLHDLYTFSAVYGEGEQGDETQFIKYYTPELKNLKWVHPSPDTLIDDIEDLLKCHLEPVPSLSIYSQYKVMKDASTFITVGIDGQGADEQLAGYHYFFGSHFKGLLRSLRLIKLVHEIASYLYHHKSTEGLQFFALYLLPFFAKRGLTHRTNGWIDDNFYQENAKKSNLLKQLYNPKDLNDSLIQHFAHKLEHNLKWNDLNSMYHSIELRVPFLDYRVVEKTLASPTHQLINEGYTKRILRDAMKGILPEELRMRKDKVGFDNPADLWMRTPKMSILLQDLLSSQTLKHSGFVNIEACKIISQNHQKGEKHASRDLWKMLHLNAFLENIKKKESSTKEIPINSLKIIT